MAEPQKRKIEASDPVEPLAEELEEAPSPAWISLCLGFVTGFVLAALSLIMTEQAPWIETPAQNLTQGKPDEAGGASRLPAAEPDATPAKSGDQK